jgi:hypothetical protein
MEVSRQSLIGEPKLNRAHGIFKTVGLTRIIKHQRRVSLLVNGTLRQVRWSVLEAPQVKLSVGIIAVIQDFIIIKLRSGTADQMLAKSVFMSLSSEPLLRFSIRKRTSVRGTIITPSDAPRGGPCY